MVCLSSPCLDNESYDEYIIKYEKLGCKNEKEMINYSWYYYLINVLFILFIKKDYNNLLIETNMHTFFYS